MGLKKLRWLGWPGVVLDGAERPLGPGRPTQLLAYLAVSGSWQPRDALARLFWPDSADRLARSNLRNLLFKAVAAAPWAMIEATEHALRLKLPSDLDDFHDALQRSDWAAAVRLGADELLQGFDHGASEPYLQWLRGEREALRTLWTQALQALLADASLPVAQREALAEAWARRCPDDEDAQRARMLLAHERGQPAVAARLYREFEATLQREFGVPPSRELARLALQGPADPAAAPAGPAAPVAGSPHGAGPASPIFGRRLELAQLGALLADESVRLIGLTGPGGVGKSTLLAALLAPCIDAGRGDVRLVDASLAPSPAAVVAMLGAALGVEGLQGENAVSVLAQAMGERRCLLLLDGAEQPGLAGPVLQLLERCPRLRLVVASRQRLHLDPELVVPVEGFPLPDAEETDVELLSRNDAVRYFATAMRQAGQALDLARDGATVALLARAVEGLPLALKLLARLTHLFTPAQLLDSVREHMAGRVGTDAPAFGELMPALVASFDRSWTSLAPPQQAVLARLAVFPGSFDVAAARAVGRTGLPVVQSLVEASLVRADGAGRLSLHAAIRACVLAVCPPPEPAEADYIEHYRQRLAALAGVARSRTVRPMREFLHLDTPNVESLWQRALQRRDFAALQSAAESLWFLCDEITGQADWPQGFAEAERTLRHDPDVPLPLRALLGAGAARATFYQGHLEPAAEAARQALRLATRARHADALRFALDMLIRICTVQRRQREAEALAERAARLDDPDRDEGLLTGLVLKQRQILSFLRGDRQGDVQVAERLEALYERFEDEDSLVRVLLAQAFGHSAAGDLARGIESMERTAARAAELGASPALQATALCEAAGWLVESGRLERARACVERANAISDSRPQARFLRLKTRLVNAALEVAAGHLEAAAAPLAELLAAMARGEELPLAEPVFLAGARWFLAMNDRATAVELLRAIAPQVWEMRTFEAAQALLRELGETASPPHGPAPSDAAVSKAAADAHRRVLQAQPRQP